MGETTAPASFRLLEARVEERWPAFQDRRAQHLRQGERYGKTPETVAVQIVRDLLVEVLDWAESDVNSEVEGADLLLTRLGIKHLVIETKRPGLITFGNAAFHKAVAQAHGYADEQRVRAVAVSDGGLLYAEDVTGQGPPRPRTYVDLTGTADPSGLWWLSMQGIYRPRPDDELHACRPAAVPVQPADSAGEETDDSSLHPKYRLPARCFAYAGNPADPRTWHLPFLHGDGSVDTKRLPKAIQAVLTNYRGAMVTSVPEAAIPGALATLGRAARAVGKMPDQDPGTANAYVRLAEALEQLGLDPLDPLAT